MLSPTVSPVSFAALSPEEKNVLSFATENGRVALARRIKADIERYCEIAYDDGPRSHLGASQLGEECERKIWFQFRWMVFEKLNGRKRRLLRRGDLEEYRFIEYLQGCGFNIQQVEVDGKQIRIAKFADGHGGGSCDGRATAPERYGLPDTFLLEFKTHNTGSGWSQLTMEGFKTNMPVHWGQACTYGKKLGLKYVVYISTNKNDDDLFVDVEELDWNLVDELEQRAERIINSQSPPVRISDTPSFFKCKWCPAVSVCHNLERHPDTGQLVTIEKNCRSCVMAEPISNGEWHCRQWNNTIPKDFIPKGCDSWQPLPR